MFHSFFLFVDRVERSLRERHALWFFGMGSGMALGVLFLMVMWQPTMAPLVSLFQGQGPERSPAALVGSTMRPEADGALGRVAEADVPVLSGATPRQESGTKDTEAAALPTVVLIGESRITLPMGSAYTDDGAVAQSAADELLPLRIYVDGVRVDEVMLDTSREGVHTITYQYQGDTGTVETTRMIQVE